MQIQVLVVLPLLHRGELPGLGGLHNEVEAIDLDLDLLGRDLDERVGLELRLSARHLERVALERIVPLGSWVMRHHVDDGLAVLREHKLLEPLIVALVVRDRAATQLDLLALRRMPRQQRRQRALLDPEVRASAIGLEHWVTMNVDGIREPTVGGATALAAPALAVGERRQRRGRRVDGRRHRRWAGTNALVNIVDEVGLFDHAFISAGRAEVVDAGSKRCDPIALLRRQSEVDHSGVARLQRGRLARRERVRIYGARSVAGRDVNVHSLTDRGVLGGDGRARADGAVVLAVELDVGQHERRLDSAVVDCHVRAPGGAIGSGLARLAQLDERGRRVVHIPRSRLRHFGARERARPAGAVGVGPAHRLLPAAIVVADPPWVLLLGAQVLAIAGRRPRAREVLERAQELVGKHGVLGVDGQAGVVATLLVGHGGRLRALLDAEPCRR